MKDWFLYILKTNMMSLPFLYWATEKEKNDAKFLYRMNRKTTDDGKSF